MANSPFHSQIEQNIQTLLVEKKFKEAYQLCQDLIAKFPGEASYNQLLLKIEKEVERENAKKIKTKIKELKPLWNTKSYGEIIRALQQITKLYPQHSESKKLLEKAQKLYAEQISELQEQYEKQQKTRLSSLLQDSPEMLIQELFELEKNNSGNQQIQKLVHEYRTALIKKKISQQEELINSNKYQDLEHFISQLHKIEENNEEIIKLEKLIKEKRTQKQFETEKEYLYENKEHINTLIKLGKYDKAIQAIEEMLDKFPKNKQLKKLLKIVNQKFFNQTKNLSIESITNNKKNLQAQYKRNKEDFVSSLGL